MIDAAGGLSLSAMNEPDEMVPRRGPCGRNVLLRELERETEVAAFEGFNGL